MAFLYVLGVQALLTAEQACRRRFFCFVEKRRAFFINDHFGQKLTIFDFILDNNS